MVVWSALWAHSWCAGAPWFSAQHHGDQLQSRDWTTSSSQYRSTYISTDLNTCILNNSSTTAAPLNYCLDASSQTTQPNLNQRQDASMLAASTQCSHHRNSRSQSSLLGASTPKTLWIARYLIDARRCLCLSVSVCRLSLCLCASDCVFWMLRVWYGVMRRVECVRACSWRWWSRAGANEHFFLIESTHPPTFSPTGHFGLSSCTCVVCPCVVLRACDVWVCVGVCVCAVISVCGFHPCMPWECLPCKNSKVFLMSIVG